MSSPERMQSYLSFARNARIEAGRRAAVAAGYQRRADLARQDAVAANDRVDALQRGAENNVRRAAGWEVSPSTADADPDTPAADSVSATMPRAFTT